MKLFKTWIIIILISDGIFFFGRFEHSHVLTFVGAIGFSAGVTCEVSILIIQFIKRNYRK